MTVSRWFECDVAMIDLSCTNEVVEILLHELRSEICCELRNLEM